MRRPLEIVVVVGVLATFGLCAVKLAIFGHHAAPPQEAVLTMDAGAAETPTPAARSSLKEIGAKLQRGEALTIAEQRELDHLAKENGTGAAIATGTSDSTTDAEPDPKPKEKPKKPERKMKAFGDASGPDIVASLKGPGKPDEKSDAFVKAAFPNLTPDQQKAISAGIVKKAAASKKDKDGPAVPVLVPNQD